jgi:hypothetical protein
MFGAHEEVHIATRSPSPASRPGKEARPPLAPRPQAPRIRRKAAATGNSITTLSPEERQRLIAEAAYYIAEQRGFAAGCELDDWLQAEAEIERRGSAGSASPATS